MKRILWLDDQFDIEGTIIHTLYDQLYVQFQASQKKDIQEIISEYKIVKVGTYDEYEYKMNESIYDIVILDIDGKKDENKQYNTVGFTLAANYARLKKTSIIIYSGQVDYCKNEIESTQKLAESENIICKVVKKGNTIIALYQAIMDIFDNDIWTKFPHIRELLEREELSQDGEWLKQILQSYIKQNFSSKIAYEFRGILEKIIKLLRADFEESLKKYYIRNLNWVNGRKKDDKIEAINKVRLSDNKFIEQILTCSHCKPQKDNLFHDNHLVIPSKVMPREVKFALNYIWELSNIYHHCNEMTPDFNEIMANNNEKVYRMTYDAFLLVLEWYYQYEKKKLCKYIKI